MSSAQSGFDKSGGGGRSSSARLGSEASVRKSSVVTESDVLKLQQKVVAFAEAPAVAAAGSPRAPRPRKKSARRRSRAKRGGGARHSKADGSSAHGGDPDDAKSKKKSSVPRTADKIGPYLVMKRIGKGAMGTVYMATNQMDGRTHAIKRISTRRVPEADREAIESEIRMLRHLSHPNIVEYIGTIREENSLNIILEYVPNGALSTMLHRFGSFTETLTCHYIAQVLDALSFLHQQGIIHRDIKGANILADAEGVVKLADFGVATVFRHDEGSSSGEERIPAGTMNFMAPEIVKMTSAPTCACDVWSLGATVIELLTGAAPYSSEEGMAICYRIVNDDHPPLPLGVSAACANFLLECFQKDPDLRVSSTALRGHEWLETHRASVRDMKNKENTSQDCSVAAVGSTPPRHQQRQGSPGGRLLDSPNARRSKSPGKHSRRLSQASYGFGSAQAVDFSRYIERDEDEGFGDLEIGDFAPPFDGSTDVEGKGGEGPVMALELTFEDDEPFALDAKDRLRFDFENRFKDLGSASDTQGVVAALCDIRGMVEANPGIISKMIPDVVMPGGTGMMAIMDLLSSRGGLAVSNEVIKCAMQLVNAVLADEAKLPSGGKTRFQDRLCTLGLVSVILRYAQRRHGMPLRLEAATFARAMCRANAYTIKMFCACGGLRVIVAMLDDGAPGTQREDHCRTMSHPILPSLVLRELERADGATVGIYTGTDIVQQVESTSQTQSDDDQQGGCTVVGVSATDASQDHKRKPQVNQPEEPHESYSSPLHASRPHRISVRSMDSKRPVAEKRHLTRLALDCMERVFEINDSPKSDMCRLLCEYGVLPRLTRAFATLRAAGETEYADKTLKCISIFAGGDVPVRQRMAQSVVLEPLLDAMPSLPDAQLEQAVKSLKMLCGLKDPAAMDGLERAGCVEVFVGLLRHPRREVHNQLLLCVDFLLDVAPQRRVEKAVTAGMIPRLLHILSKEPTMGQVVHKILCSLPMASPRVRLALKKNAMVSYYVQWLALPLWRAQALTALGLWLHEEPRFVGQILSGLDCVGRLVATCTGPSVSRSHVAKALPPLLAMSEDSPVLARALAEAKTFVSFLAGRLFDRARPEDPKWILVLSASARLLAQLTERHPDAGRLATTHKITQAIKVAASSAREFRKVRLELVLKGCLRSVLARVAQCEPQSSVGSSGDTTVKPSKENKDKQRKGSCLSSVVPCTNHTPWRACACVCDGMA